MPNALLTKALTPRLTLGDLIVPPFLEKGTKNELAKTFVSF